MKAKEIIEHLKDLKSRYGHGIVDIDYKIGGAIGAVEKMCKRRQMTKEEQSLSLCAADNTYEPADHETEINAHKVALIMWNLAMRIGVKS